MSTLKQKTAGDLTAMTKNWGLESIFRELLRKNKAYPRWFEGGMNDPTSNVLTFFMIVELDLWSPNNNPWIWLGLGNFIGGNSPGGNLPGGIWPGGNLPGATYQGGIWSGGIHQGGGDFPSTNVLNQHIKICVII